MRGVCPRWDDKMLIKSTTEMNALILLMGKLIAALLTQPTTHSSPHASSHFSSAGERASARKPKSGQVRSKLQWNAISGCHSRGCSITTMILWRRVLPQAAHNHRCHPVCSSSDRCISGLCPEEIDERRRRWAWGVHEIRQHYFRLRLVLTIVCWWAQAAVGRGRRRWRSGTAPSFVLSFFVLALLWF